jgi:hypothetical protein
MSNDDDTETGSDEYTAMLEDNWEEVYERDRGILTDIDRQFLMGVREYDSKVTRSERRRTIRDRVVQSLRDLHYLNKVEERQREKVFETLEDSPQADEPRVALAALIRFLYPAVDGDIEWFEETISHGFNLAVGDERDDDTTYYTGEVAAAGVDVDISVREGYNVDHIERVFRSNGSMLTATEIGILAREGRLSEDDLANLNSDTRFSHPRPGARNIFSEQIESAIDSPGPAAVLEVADPDERVNESSGDTES